MRDRRPARIVRLAPRHLSDVSLPSTPFTPGASGASGGNPSTSRSSTVSPVDQLSPEPAQRRLSAFFSSAPANGKRSEPTTSTSDPVSAVRLRESDSLNSPSVRTCTVVTS